MYWLLFIIPFPIVGYLAYIYGCQINENYLKRVYMNFPFCASDLHWTNSFLIYMGTLSFITGVLPNALGTGGGIILGPILISLIHHPLVSAASSNALIVITSFSSTIQFALMGKINFRYALFSLIITCVGSFIGSYTIKVIVEKTGRASYVIIALAIITLISTIIIPINSLIELIDRNKKGYSLMETGDICDS